MAGVKGRSGGARPNTGGARPGAGRKKKPTVKLVPVVEKVVDVGQPDPGPPSVSVVPVHNQTPEIDPRPMLEQIALGHLEVSTQQYKALVALLPYVHSRKGEGGKKEGAAAAAKKVAGGRFGAVAPPRLVKNG